jgi:hypothetical protein
MARPTRNSTDQWLAMNVSSQPDQPRFRLYRRVAVADYEPAREFDQIERDFAGSIAEFASEHEAQTWLEHRLSLELFGIAHLDIFDVELEGISALDGSMVTANRRVAHVDAEAASDVAIDLQTAHRFEYEWRDVSAKKSS